MNNNDIPENVHRAKLLDRRAIPLTPGDIPVATDVLLHNLEPFALEALRRTMEQGLKPSGLDFTGDDDSSVILRLARPRAVEARLMVGVESQLKYATVPSNAHLAGSVRATVSRLLCELAAKFAGDPSF